MSTVELTHPVVVVTDEHGSYRAECGCGWASDWYEDDDLAAELAGIEHVQIVIDPPDPLDQCLTNLLDLQENLAELVIWLADNWSADLPAPALGAYCFHPEDFVLCLHVVCPDPATVRAVAELLGTTVVYSDTARMTATLASFGQVHLEAIYLPPELVS